MKKNADVVYMVLVIIIGIVLLLTLVMSSGARVQGGDWRPTPGPTPTPLTFYLPAIERGYFTTPVPPGWRPTPDR